MAYIRQLPSGKWQATVRGTDGKRHTRTDKLKKVVEKWATAQEAAVNEGKWHGPRAGQITVDKWHQKFLDMRSVEALTTAQDASTWRVHVAPKWSGWLLNAIDVEAVKTWRVEMDKAGVGPHAQTKALNYLSAMLSSAVPKRITSNPVHEVDRPQAPLKTPFYWTLEERAAILRVSDERWKVAFDLALHVGLRPGELYGMPASAVNWARGLIHITQVWTRKGIKKYPKTAKSYRTVPIPDHLMDSMREILSRFEEPDEDTPLFPAAKGGWMDDRRFQRRVLDPALAVARLCGRPVADSEAKHGRCWEGGCDSKRHRVRKGSPNDARHTAASQLVIEGKSLYKVQKLLGHESPQTTQRYAHLGPEQYDDFQDAWSTSSNAVTHGLTHEEATRSGSRRLL